MESKTLGAKAHLTTEMIENVAKLMERYRSSGQLPATKWSASFDWLPALPDTMKSDYARYDEDDDSLVMPAFSEHAWDAVHYYNCHYPVEDVPADDPTVEWPTTFGEQAHSVTWMLNDIESHFGDSSISANTFTVSGLARQLAMWMHNAGDIHQPMHVGGISYSTCYPESDKGGNDVLVDANENTPMMQKLKDDAGVGNMHALWDSMLWTDEMGAVAPRSGYYHTYHKSYLEEENQLFTDAQTIMDEYPCADLEAEGLDLNLNWTLIAEESHMHYRTAAFNKTLIPEDVYKCATGVEPEPFYAPDEYIIAAHALVKKQVALAGCRIERKMPAVLANIDFSSVLDFQEQIARQHKCGGAFAPALIVSSLLLVFGF